MRSILELWPVLAAAGIDVIWNVTVDSLVTRARNELVARFLRSEATHLFFVDSDIGFTPEQVLEMLRFNEPFVAGVYPLKALPLSGVGKKLEPCERRGRFVTGEFCEAEFMLLKRQAIERMIEAYPNFIIGTITCGGGGASRAVRLHDPRWYLPQRRLHFLSSAASDRRHDLVRAWTHKCAARFELMRA